ncbi:hypothetical protein V4C53_45175, partial [Paraburkholderia azotifigens]
FLRLRGSPVFSLALYGIIQAGLMMLRFYTTRSIFAIPPSGQSPYDALYWVIIGVLEILVTYHVHQPDSTRHPAPRDMMVPEFY